MHAKSLQSCLTLCDPKDHSPPGSSVHGILQARILEWVAMPSSRGSSWARNWTSVSWGSCITGRFFTHWATWEIHAKSTNPRLNICSSDTLLPFFVHVTFPLFHTSSLTPIQLLYLTRFLRTCLTWFFSFPGGSVGKEPACNAGDLGLIPGLGRPRGKGHGYPLQYSCLGNPMTEETSRLQSMGLQESETT